MPIEHSHEQGGMFPLSTGDGSAQPYRIPSTGEDDYTRLISQCHSGKYLVS